MIPLQDILQSSRHAMRAFTASYTAAQRRHEAMKNKNRIEEKLAGEPDWLLDDIGFSRSAPQSCASGWRHGAGMPQDGTSGLAAVASTVRHGPTA